MAAFDPITGFTNAISSMFDAAGSFFESAASVANTYIQGQTAEYIADRQLDMQREITRRVQLLTQNIKSIIIIFLAGSVIVATVKAKSLTPVFALAGLLLLYIAYLKYVKPMK